VDQIGTRWEEGKLAEVRGGPRTRVGIIPAVSLLTNTGELLQELNQMVVCSLRPCALNGQLPFWNSRFIG
jgi:hypothetical protein